MEHKAALLRLLILFLGLSYVLSFRLLPQSAYLKSDNEGPPVQEFVKQGLIKGRSYGEGFTRVGMDIESSDYSGAGANNHHGPKTPGRG